MYGQKKRLFVSNASIRSTIQHEFERFSHLEINNCEYMTNINAVTEDMKELE